MRRSTLRCSHWGFDDIELDPATGVLVRRREGDTEAERRTVRVHLELVLRRCLIATISNQEEIVHLNGGITELESRFQEWDDARLGEYCT